jgi:hypothetical protein
MPGQQEDSMEIRALTCKRMCQHRLQLFRCQVAGWYHAMERLGRSYRNSHKPPAYEFSQIVYEMLGPFVWPWAWQKRQTWRVRTLGLITMPQSSRLMDAEGYDIRMHGSSQSVH